MKKENKAQQPNSAVSNRLALGIGPGLAIGIGLGAAMHNIGAGTALGLIFGIALGIIWQKNANP